MSLLRLALGLAFLPGVGELAAAPIQYGDFEGTTVMYLDVTETANTPGAPDSLLGPPTIQGDSLGFSAPALGAEALGPVGALRDGQLNFTVMASGRPTIRNLSASAGGVYTLQGNAGAGTRIGYALSLSSVTVVEVDYAALATPVALGAAARSGEHDLSSGSMAEGTWNLGLFYDVNAALAAAGVSFSNGATKLEVAMDFMVMALGEAGSQSMVAGDSLGVAVNAADPAIPVLTIVRSGADEVTLSWSPATPGFLLQESPGLGASGWDDAPSGATNPVTLPISGTRKFFRLFRP